MKILISDALSPAAADVLRVAGHDVTVKTGLPPDELVATLQGCAALLVRGATKVTSAVIEKSPALRVVARAGTGLDNIDVAAAKQRGITVLNTPAANAISVAELTIGLVLALERHLVGAASDLRQGRWEKTKYAAGREVCGRSLALIGFGRIGREVALRARAFSMTVTAFDPGIHHWPAGFDWATRAESLDQLLGDADYLSLHIPLTGQTKNLIAARELGLMKKSAVLVNCARGGVVDEVAVATALRADRLGGAALDVFEHEPLGVNSPLAGCPRLILTPHIAGVTRESNERVSSMIAQRVTDALTAGNHR